jgi:hypothetical protein
MKNGEIILCSKDNDIQYTLTHDSLTVITGDNTQAIIAGKNAICLGAGKNQSCSGDDIGNVLFLTEWKRGKIMAAWAGIVGEGGIKPFTAYQLKNGKPKEIKNPKR